MSYFDIKRDLAIASDGGLFCSGCLSGKPIQETSPDPRYCQDCYDFLLQEAKLVTSWKRPDWIPSEPLYKPVEPVLEWDKSAENGDIHPMKMSTTKRGCYKKQELSVDFIRRLNDTGMGSKAIATRLRAEHDIQVTYKTIQRVLSGERNCLAFRCSSFYRE